MTHDEFDRAVGRIARRKAIWFFCIASDADRSGSGDYLECVTMTKSKHGTPTLFTLADARRHQACVDGYARFENALRQAHPDVADLDTIQWSIGDVARVNLDDALWCLRMMADPRQRVAAIMPAVRRASRHTDDSRVHDCITQIDRWLTGEDVDLDAAATAAAWAANVAWAAAARAARAAEAAAWAARAAAWSTWATGAARAAARAAAAYEQERAQQVSDLILAFPPTFGEKA